MLAEPIGNIGQTASVYSQVAGTLAGLTFTALLLYFRGSAQDSVEANPATPEAADENARSQAKFAAATRGSVAVVLFGTLVALTVCAVLYGILAGGLPNSGNSKSGLLLYGTPFSLAVLSIFYATGLASSEYTHLEAMRRITLLVVGVTGPALAMLLIAAAALDVCGSEAERCRGVNPWTPTHPFGFGVVLSALLAALLATAFILRKSAAIGMAGGVAPEIIASLVLGSSIVAGFLAVILDLAPADFSVAHWGLYLSEFTTMLLLAAFGLLAIASLERS